MKFADRMSRLGTESAFEVLAKAKGLEAQGRDIIHLEIGQPDFITPMNICEAAFQAMKDGHTGYGPSAGLLEFREVVAEHIRKHKALTDKRDETSRAVTSIETLVKWSAPLLKINGRLICYKGPEPDAEIDQAEDSIASCNCLVEKVLKVKGLDKMSKMCLVIIKKEGG